jgi:excisionase family DNA binding protein
VTDSEMTVKQAASTLTVSARTVRRYLQTGKLSGRKVDRAGGRKEWRVSEDSVRTLAASGQVRPVAGGKRADLAAEELKLLRAQNAELMTVMGQLVTRIGELESTVQKALPAAAEPATRRTWWQRLWGR